MDVYLSVHFSQFIISNTIGYWSFFFEVIFERFVFKRSLCQRIFIIHTDNIINKPSGIPFRDPKTINLSQLSRNMANTLAHYQYKVEKTTILPRPLPVKQKIPNRFKPTQTHKAHLMAKEEQPRCSVRGLLLTVKHISAGCRAFKKAWLSHNYII